MNSRVLKTPEQIENREIGSPVVVSDKSFFTGAAATKKPLPLSKNKFKSSRVTKTREEQLAEFAEQPMSPDQSEVAKGKKTT